MYIIMTDNGREYRINGAYIRRRDGSNRSVELRGTAQAPNWYDEKHAAVMRAKYALEDAIKALDAE
jgi:hypothetical protein